MIKYISALFASDCIPRGLLRAGPRNLRINAPLLAAGMVCLILLSVAGCASTKTRYIKAYDGPERTLEEIAVVKCSPGVGVRIPLRLDTGGDIKVGDMYPDRGDGGVWARRCEISLLPGNHTLYVCFWDSYYANHKGWGYRWCGRDLPVSFKARAGRIYLIRYKVSWNNWEPLIDDVTEIERAKVEDERLGQKTEKK